jgi:hypothetical protein
MSKFGKGWYFEPHRHSLAAKGISTSLALKNKSWAKIFPTQSELSEAPGGMTRHEYWEEQVRRVLQKPVLEEGDRQLIMQFFAEEFQADIPSDPYREEVIDPVTGEVTRLGTMKDYVAMIRNLAQQKAALAIKQHDEYFSGGGREKLLADVKERIDDVMEEAALEPDLQKRQEIINAELTALAASVKSTKEEIPLAFPEEEIRAELMKLGPLVGKTPEEIIAMAPAIEMPLVKPLLRRELEPVSEERFTEARKARREQFFRTLSPQEKEELLKTLTGGKLIMEEEISVPKITFEPHIETSEERSKRLQLERAFARRGPFATIYGTPPPGLLPELPKYWRPEIPKAPSPEEWGAWLETIRAAPITPLEAPMYLRPLPPEKQIPVLRSRELMKKVWPGLEHYRRQPGGSIELGVSKMQGGKEIEPIAIPW